MGDETMTTPSIELLTKSYRGDFEHCELLCKSMDQFVPADIMHTLVVPRSDIKLFSRLLTDRRRIVAEDELLPSWFWRVPLPSPEWRRRLHLPRRDIYLTPFSPPVRGWIAQQIMKIAGAAASSADIVVHIDSENVFIRPLKVQNIVRAGKVRIYRDPQPAGLGTHVRWQRVAGKLLGLPEQEFYGGEYISSLVVWKTSVVRGMIERIESVGKQNWIKILARTPHFAEYVLYGLYADRIVGFEKAGLQPEEFSLSHTRWSDAFADAADMTAFVDAVEPYHVTCLVQSTIAEDNELRRELFARITERARLQDASVGSS
jgi:hypothetical protein